MKKFKMQATAMAVLMLGSTAACVSFPTIAHAEVHGSNLSTPTHLKTYAVTSSLIDLIWDPVYESDVTYSVYQDGKLVASGLSKSNCSASGLSPNHKYIFQVVAKDATGAVSKSTPPLVVATQTAGPEWQYLWELVVQHI